MWPFTRHKAETRVLTWYGLLGGSGFYDSTGFTHGLPPHAALRRISGWIAIACRPVQDRLAGLQWQGVGSDGRELVKSRFADLLRKPNPAMSGGLMLRAIASTLIVSGESYLILRRGRRSGRVAELWPVEPSRVSRVWQDGSLFYDVSPGCHFPRP